MHYVYFIEMKNKKGKSPVKIGLSDNPEKRLKDLQTANPNKLILRRKIEMPSRKQAQLLERCLHNLGKKQFKALEGEWFIVFGSWDKLISEAQKMVSGVIKDHPVKYRVKSSAKDSNQSIEEKLDRQLLFGTQ